MTSELEEAVVPPYLIELFKNLDRSALRRALASVDSERELVALAIDAQAKLDKWSNDQGFWRSLSTFLGEPLVIDEPLGDLLDDEVEIAILSGALLGDEQLAIAVLLEAPTSLSPVTTIDVENVQKAVVQINLNVTMALNAPPTPRRRWRLAKTLRRVFKGAAGGIVIAADVVVPDPTLLVRVASLVGGVDMILDAAGSNESVTASPPQTTAPQSTATAPKQ
jgi:hypothetical protein